MDVTEYGVVGDGEADDTNAFRRAAAAATPHGTLYVPSDARVRLTEAVDVPLNDPDHERFDELNRFVFRCEGALSPEAGATVHFHRGEGARLFVRVEGGGVRGEGSVDGGGVKEPAVRLSNLRASHVDAYANDYPGTVLQLDRGTVGTGSLSQTSVGEVKTLFCGRAMYLGPGPDADEWDFTGGFGAIGDVWEHDSVRCFTAEKTNDLTVGQYENYVGERNERGVVIDNCNALWVDKMSIGGDASVPLAEIRNLSLFNFGLLSNDQNTHGDNLVFDSVSHGRANVMPHNSGGTALRVDETGHEETTDVRFTVSAVEPTDTGVAVTENVSGDWLAFSGTVRDGQREDTVGVDVRTDIRVVLSELHATGNAGGDLRVPADNQLHLLDSAVEDVRGEPATDRRL